MSKPGQQVEIPMSLDVSKAQKAVGKLLLRGKVWITQPHMSAEQKSP